MAVEKLTIEKFLQLAKTCPVFDVRSPAEFGHAHIPAAFSLPLFTDDQRKLIGTAYKQQSRQVAVKIGLEFFSERMKTIPPAVEEIITDQKSKSGNGHAAATTSILVHCWRGGMRSGAVAWLLDLFGYKVFTLSGGYKSFRRWALDQFTKNYTLQVIGGYTGSGKTGVLQQLRTRGETVIDLEALANHKGSAFGALGELPQPGQEMFENLLACELFRASTAITQGDGGTEAVPDLRHAVIWIEDESKHIGTAGLPNAFWEQMRGSRLYFLDIPFEERLSQIVNTYGAFDTRELVSSIERIQKRLGGLEAKSAIAFLREGKTREGFEILLRYYDKFYKNSLYNRENIDRVLNKIPCPTVDINNAAHLCAETA
jgi:tRNA 2-selenouridine synthase